jgi:hypothetical protein
MKKWMICFSVLAFMIVPTWALACTPGDPTCSSITVDVKGYGNQFANYSVGEVMVTSYIDRYEEGESVDWTAFNNSTGGICPGDCGMSISQGNIAEVDWKSWTDTTVKQNALIGSADMTSLGGLSACVESYYGAPTAIKFDGTLYQTHTVENAFSGNLPNFGYASGSYTGTQTLDLNLNN